MVERFGSLPGGEWPESPEAALVLPIMRPGQGHPFGLLIAGLSSRRALDEGYRSFCELVADHIATAVANARAHEEERRRAEALAELDRAKTAFFNNVSHEFRTPLTLMLGPLEEALADHQLPDEQAQRLELIHRNALRLLKLVNTLLDFSRIEAGRTQAVFQPTDLAALTAEQVSAFRSAIESAGLQLVVDCLPLPEPVYVDREMWQKIVLNLLSNAFKFNLSGSIRLHLRALPEHVELIVRDTGTGIPPEELPNIFVRFHRIRGAQARTHEGTGIGLALVQELVRLHGGTIHVQSEVGQGSTFTVRVPRGASHLPPERTQAVRTVTSTALGAVPCVQEAIRWLPDAPPESIAGGLEPGLAHSARPAHILLANDNADMRDYVKRLLSAGPQAWTVEAVADGHAALTAIRQRPPDLVLSDVMMPGLDGFQLLRALRSDPAAHAIPVILLSARAGEEARVEGLNAGADDYIVKPFSSRELIARINAQLEVARREQAARRHLEAILHQIPAGVIIAEAPSGKPLIVNEQAKRLTGYAFDEPIQVENYAELPYFKVLRRDGRPYTSEEMPLSRAVRLGEVVVGEEIALALPGGQRLVLLVNASPIRSDEGEIVAGVVTMIDITARRTAEAVLRERARLLTGEFDIQSAPGQGTTVLLKIPLLPGLRA